jgi:flagellar hook-associated protein 2
MATLQLSGLASGFDWKSFVDSVIDAERFPITRLNTEKTGNTSKVSALDTIATRMRELQTTAKGLAVEGLFSGRTAKSSNSTSSWGLSATASAPVGTYAVAVSQLATATRRSGTGDIGAGLSATADVSGLTLASLPTAAAVSAGVFSVNGAQVSVALTDTLQDVFDRISTATSGAVTASYDPATDKISLSSASEIVLGASNDTSNFLRVAKLENNGTGAVASTGTLGTASVTAPLASARLRTPISAVDGSGNGSFTINGVAISYNVNTDSMSAVLNKINSSSAGVTAAYDATADRVVLTNKTTGNVGLSVSEAAGGFLAAAGISGGTTAAGKNALYTVNGGPQLSSQTNTLDASSHGITGLSITATSESTETITVGADTGRMRKAIEDFVGKFNALQSYIDDQSKVTTSNGKVTASLLANNREVQSWSSSLRSMVFQQNDSLTGTIKRLEHLGIDFASGTGAPQLQIKDGAKLDAALASSAGDVEAFFKQVAAKIDAFATTILGTGTSSSGLINAQKNNLLSQNTGIDKQIADIERRLVQQRANLEAGFIAMERAQSTIQQMQQQLTQAFGSNTK